MDRDLEEKAARKKSNEMFNSITEKQKPENQNQTHNSRREGMGPNAKRKLVKHKVERTADGKQFSNTP